PPVLQALHGFSMPPIALTPMLDKLADTSVGTINLPLTARSRPRVWCFDGSYAPASLVSGKNAGVPHIPRCRRPLADNRVSRLDLSSRKCFHPSAFPTSCNSFHARPL